MKLFWDLDGVLRDLSYGCFGFEQYDWNYEINGKNVIDIVNDNLDILTYAPATEYVPIFKKYLSFNEILTVQLDHWVEKTKVWLLENLNLQKLDLLHITKNQEEKLTFLGKNDYLIEDYPFLSNYDKVILISRNYNLNVINPFARIRNPEELDILIDRLILIESLKWFNSII